MERMRQLLAKDTDPHDDRRQQEANTTTFAEAAEGWINKRKSKWRSQRHVRILLKNFKSIANKPVSQITKQMIVNTLEDLWERHPEQARRALTMSARVFDYAKAHDMRTGDNPAEWRGLMENIFPDRDKDNEKHYPSLSFKGMPEFIRRLRLRQMRGTSAVALEFQILTATRPGETRGAIWSEFDLINRVWVLPPKRTKQKRQHRVPLSKRCMELLALQNEYSSALNPDGFVFQGYNRTALDQKATRILLKNMGIPVTAHGFRSSFRNWAGAGTRISFDPNNPEQLERIPRELAELCLAHLVKGKTEAAYWRDDGLEERRSIMNAWAEYCEGH